MNRFLKTLPKKQMYSNFRIDEVHTLKKDNYENDSKKEGFNRRYGYKTNKGKTHDLVRGTRGTAYKAYQIWCNGTQYSYKNLDFS